MELQSDNVRKFYNQLSGQKQLVWTDGQQKSPQLESVNQKLLETIQPEQVEVENQLAEEEAMEGIAESKLDEMWSYVGKKTRPALAVAR